MKTLFQPVPFRQIGRFVLFISLILGMQSCMHTAPFEGEDNAYIGTQAPAFELKDINGNIYRSGSLKGKFAIIHIATTWCPFCNAEAPYLEKIYQEYQPKGVEVLIIDVKESAALVKEKLIDQFGLSFPVLLDSDGKVAASFAPADVLPDLARDDVMLASNLLLDREGKIRYFSLLDTKDFDAQLVGLKSVLDALL